MCDGAPCLSEVRQVRFGDVRLLSRKSLQATDLTTGGCCWYSFFGDTPVMRNCDTEVVEKWAHYNDCRWWF